MNPTYKEKVEFTVQQNVHKMTSQSKFRNEFQRKTPFRNSFLKWFKADLRYWELKSKNKT